MKTIKLKQETFDGYMTKIENLKRELAVVTGQRANTIKQSQTNSSYYKGEIDKLKVDKLNLKIVNNKIAIKGIWLLGYSVAVTFCGLFSAAIYFM